MQDKIKEQIAELEHTLSHAEEEKTRQMAHATSEAQRQLAVLDGRLTQKIESDKETLERLKGLLPIEVVPGGELEEADE